MQKIKHWTAHTEELEMAFPGPQTEAVQTPFYHQGHLLSQMKKKTI